MGGGDRATPADEFLSLRTTLLRQAAAMLGSAADAEDVVQEVWFRWHRHGSTVVAPRAWLQTVTRNMALDRVRDRRTWSVAEVEQAADVEVRSDRPTRAEVMDEMAAGFRPILERLSPLERVVFVLHDGLSWSYSDIRRLLSRSELAVRQLRHRAKTHLTAGRQRFVASGRQVAEVSRAYVDVSAGGDLSTLLRALAPDLVVVPPGHRRVDGRLVHDVCGLVLGRGRRMLLCHRRADLPWYPEVWDVPGSHLLSGESAVAGAVRAAKHELGVSADGPRPLIEVSGDDFSFTLVQVAGWQGEPRNAAPEQHDAIGFFTREEAARLPLASSRYLELFDLIGR